MTNNLIALRNRRSYTYTLATGAKEGKQTSQKGSLPVLTGEVLVLGTIITSPAECESQCFQVILA